MARGGSNQTGQGGAPSRARQLIDNRITTIEKNHRLLKESISRHYSDRQVFINEWVSSSFEAEERIAALERFYDRIINSLNQLVDQSEAALKKAGKERPAAPSKDQPGRWQRLEIYGVLEKKHVKAFQRLAQRRNIFQKEYPDLGPDAAADIYDDAEDFLARLPKVLPRIHNWALDSLS